MPRAGVVRNKVGFTLKFDKEYGSRRGDKETMLCGVAEIRKTNAGT